MLLVREVSLVMSAETVIEYSHGILWTKGLIPLGAIHVGCILLLLYSLAFYKCPCGHEGGGEWAVGGCKL